MQAAFDAGLAIIAAETFAAVGRYVDAPELGVDVRERLHGAQRVTKEQLAAAELVRASFTAEVDAALEGVDALVLPTMPVPTLTLVEGRDGRAAIRVTAFVRPFNLSGHPAISIPLPPRAGYSVGLQLVGRRGGDAELCAVARAVEAAM
jgi:amidase